MTALLEVDGLKKHFPIHKGVFSKVFGGKKEPSAGEQSVPGATKLIVQAGQGGMGLDEGRKG